MNRCRLARIVLGLMALIIVQDAMGFAWLNPRRRWFTEDLPRPVWIDPSGFPSVLDFDNGVLSLLIAVEQWEVEGVGQLIIPIRGGPTGPDDIPGFAVGDGVSVISMQNQVGVCEGACIAGTSITEFVLPAADCGGNSYQRTIDSDISFNATGHLWTSIAEEAFQPNCVNEWYVEHVALHEVGHLFGLAHPPDNSAVMGLATTCNAGKTQLRPDDIAGIQDGYACALSQGGIFFDADGDGSGQDVDCNDQNSEVAPGAAEICDLEDSDCDGLDDAAEGLHCAETCLSADNASEILEIIPGACTGSLFPNFRNFFVRGALDDLRANGGVAGTAVRFVSCPRPYVYDRVSESTSGVPGTGWFFLLRDPSDLDYGTDSSGQPRLPLEVDCP